MSYGFRQADDSGFDLTGPAGGRDGRFVGIGAAIASRRANAGARVVAASRIDGGALAMGPFDCAAETTATGRADRKVAGSDHAS